MFVFMSYCFSILKNCVHRREKNNEQNTKKMSQVIIIFHHSYFFNKRRGLGGLPTRLIKGRAGSVQSGSAGADDGSLQDESSLDGEENEKQ